MFVIKQAIESEFQVVRIFYHSLIEAMQNADYKPGWEKDIYPSPELIENSIQNKELYIGLSDGNIASAMVVNHEFNEGYQKTQWPTPAEPHELSVIHALGVHSDFSGLGYAKAMVEKVLSLAKEDDQKVVRLDVLKGNIPARKLYTSLGFRYVDTIQMFYDDTGWTDYELFEYTLQTSKDKS